MSKREEVNVITAFVGNEQGKNARVGKRMLALAIAVAATLFALMAVAPAPKASAATVTNPGPFTGEFVGGYLKIGNTLEPFAIADLGGDEPPTMDGTINGTGEIHVPAANLSFDELEMALEDLPLVGSVTLGILIFAPQDITGTLDPITGETALDVKLSVKIRRIAGSSLADVGNNCYVGNPSQPVGGAGPIWVQPNTSVGPDPNAPEGFSLGGIPYDVGTGEFRVADQTFFVPGQNGCSGLAAGLVNDQVGIPSASGNNTAELQIKMDPAPLSTATITIGTRPANPTNQTTANFGFSSDVGPALDYECRLDSGSWAPCNSMTASYSSLADGPHTFTVRAMAGETEAGTASYSWSIDTVAPVINITGGPTGLTNSRNATFNTTKSEPLSSITCLLDGNPVTPCNPTGNFTNSFTNLADGAHSFTVSGQDAAGNPATTTRNWTVDGTKPVVEFTSTPPNPSSTAEVQFEFTATDNMTANPQAQCQVRNMRVGLPAGQIVQAWTNCTSPNNQVRPTGKWRFELRATDNAGNVSDIATYDWDANTAEPVIDSFVGPGGPIEENTGGTVDATDANFEFQANTYDIDGEVIPDTTFRYECWLDGDFLGDCEPPMTLHDLTGGTPLTEGAHVFEVKPYLVAVPEVDGFRTAYHWFVDTVDPTAAFENTPDEHHNSSVAEFTLDIDGTGSNGTALCKLDNQANWQACDSNTDHSVTVADGHHKLQLKARDQAGNESPVVEYEWTTDTVDPTAAITQTPLDNDKSGEAGFEFVVNDDRPGLQAFCQLDGDAPVECDAPGHHYPEIIDGVHTFTLTVVDAAGNEVQRTHTWRGDTTAPALTIEDGPDFLTTLTNAAFKFAGTDDGSGIESVDCRIDGGAWEPCMNDSVWNFYPGPFPHGIHKFEVRVIDVAQNSTIRDRSWLVSLAKPDIAIATTIGETTSTSASIKFLSSHPSATFECKLNTGAWEVCTSPKDYSNLSVGNHVFQVRSIDTAGNKSDEESLGWTVNAEVCPDGTTGTPPNCVPDPVACPPGTTGTPPDCVPVEEVCPPGTTGTPPNCVTSPPERCDEGFIGSPPNCKRQLPPLPNPPNGGTGVFDGRTLTIRLKCPARMRPRCIGNAVAVTGRGKNARVMSSRVRNTSRANGWRLVRLTIRPAFRQRVLNMTTVNRKQLIVRQNLRSRGKKPRVVFHTYRVRAKG